MRGSRHIVILLKSDGGEGGGKGAAAATLFHFAEEFFHSEVLCQFSASVLVEPLAELDSRGGSI